jgi:hypothetical protein
MVCKSLISLVSSRGQLISAAETSASPNKTTSVLSPASHRDHWLFVVLAVTVAFVPQWKHGMLPGAKLRIWNDDRRRPMNFVGEIASMQTPVR